MDREVRMGFNFEERLGQPTPSPQQTGFNFNERLDSPTISTPQVQQPAQQPVQQGFNFNERLGEEPKGFNFEERLPFKEFTNLSKLKKLALTAANPIGALMPQQAVQGAMGKVAETPVGRSLLQGGAQVALMMHDIPAGFWSSAKGLMATTEKVTGEMSPAVRLAASLINPALNVASAAGDPDEPIPEILVNNPITNALEQMGDSISYQRERFGDKDLIQTYKTEGAAAASEHFAHSVLINMPQLMAVVATAMSGAPVGTIQSVFGAAAAGGQLRGLRDQGKLDPRTQSINTAFVGAANGILEELGTGGLFTKSVKNLVNSAGKEQTFAIVKQSLKTLFQQSAGEFAEEYSTSIAEDLTGIATGEMFENDDWSTRIKSMATRALEPGLVGFASGALMASPSAHAVAKNEASKQRIAKYEEKIKFQIEKEKKRRQQPLKVLGRAEKQVKPDVIPDAGPRAIEPQQPVPQKRGPEGTGHTRFRGQLEGLADEGTLAHEEVDFLMDVFANVRDDFIGSINLRSDTFIGSGKLGQADPSARSIKVLNKLFDKSSDPLLDKKSVASAIFLHEFGHIGHQTLLSHADRETIMDLFETTNGADRTAFFEKGVGRETSAHTGGMSHSKETAMREWFVQSFAEYVFAKHAGKAPPKTYTSKFLVVLEKLYSFLQNRLIEMVNQDHSKINELSPMFEKMLTGQAIYRTNSFGQPSRSPIWNRGTQGKYIQPEVDKVKRELDQPISAEEDHFIQARFVPFAKKIAAREKLVSRLKKDKGRRADATIEPTSPRYKTLQGEVMKEAGLTTQKLNAMTQEEANVILKQVGEIIKSDISKNQMVTKVKQLVATQEARKYRAVGVEKGKTYNVQTKDYSGKVRRFTGRLVNDGKNTISFKETGIKGSVERIQVAEKSTIVSIKKPSQNQFRGYVKLESEPTNLWSKADTPTTEAITGRSTRIEKGILKDFNAKTADLDALPKTNKLDEKIVLEKMKGIRGGEVDFTIRINDGKVVDGQHRLEALKRLGIKTARVDVQNTPQLKTSIPDLKNIRPFEREKIQLTDIWNKANQAQGLKEIGIDETTTEVRSEKEQKKLEKQREQKAADEGVKVILKGQKTPAKVKPVLSKLAKIKRGIRHFFLTYDTAETLALIMDGNKRGIHVDKVIALRNAVLEGMELTAKDQQELAKLSKDVTPFEMSTRKHNVGRWADTNMNFLLHIYAMSKDAHGRAVLRNTAVEGDTIEGKPRKISEKDIQAVTDYVNKKGNLKFRMFADSLTNDFLVKRKQRIDKVYERMTGRHLPTLKNYFPIVFLDILDSKEAIEAELNQRDSKLNPKTTTGSIKERVKHSKPMKKIGLMEALYKHVNDSNRYVSQAETVRDISRYFGNKDVRAALTQKFGTADVNDYMDLWLRQISRGTSTEEDAKTWQRVLGMVRQTAYPMFLGLKITSGIKTTLSFFPAVHLIGKVNAAFGVFKMFTPRKTIQFVHGKSIMMRNRGFSFSPDAQRLQAQRSARELIFKKKGWSKTTAQLVLLPLMMGDMITTTSIWYGAYHKKMSKDPSNEKAAIEFADDVVSRTQPTGDLVNAAEVYRSNEGVRLLHLFTTYLNKLYNLQRTEFHELTDPEGGNILKRGAHWIDFQMWALIIPAFLLGKLSSAFWPDKEKRKGAAKLFEGFGDALTGLLLGNFLFLRALTSDRNTSKTVLATYEAEIKKLRTKKGLPAKVMQGAKLAGAATGVVPFQVFKFLSNRDKKK